MVVLSPRTGPHNWFLSVVPQVARLGSPLVVLATLETTLGCAIIMVCKISGEIICRHILQTWQMLTVTLNCPRRQHAHGSFTWEVSSRDLCAAHSVDIGHLEMLSTSSKIEISLAKTLVAKTLMAKKAAIVSREFMCSWVFQQSSVIIPRQNVPAPTPPPPPILFTRYRSPLPGLIGSDVWNTWLFHPDMLCIHHSRSLRSLVPRPSSQLFNVARKKARGGPGT